MRPILSSGTIRASTDAQPSLTSKNTGNLIEFVDMEKVLGKDKEGSKV